MELKNKSNIKCARHMKNKVFMDIKNHEKI